MFLAVSANFFFLYFFFSTLLLTKAFFNRCILMGKKVGQSEKLEGTVSPRLGGGSANGPYETYALPDGARIVGTYGYATKYGSI